MSRPTFDDVQVGDQLPGRTFLIGRQDLVRYAGASGDFNTIHWNQRVARDVGLPDVIAHGMFTMATAVRVVTAWCDDPGAVVQYGVRFTKPVPVPDVEGARLRVDGVVAGKDDDARTVRIDLTATIPSAGDGGAGDGGAGDGGAGDGGGGGDGGGDDSAVAVLGRARAVVRLP